MPINDYVRTRVKLLNVPADGLYINMKASFHLQLEHRLQTGGRPQSHTGPPAIPVPMEMLSIRIE